MRTTRFDPSTGTTTEHDRRKGRDQITNAGVSDDHWAYNHRDTGIGCGWMPNSSARKPRLDEFSDLFKHARRTTDA